MGIASHANSVDNISDASRLTLAELQRALLAVEPGVLLVAPRILRRVIKDEHRVPRLRWHLPHGTSYLVSRQRLLEIVDRVDLPEETAARLPDQVILLPQPDAEDLDSTPAAELLARYWRWLFHERVHLALSPQQGSTGHDPALLQSWLHRIGMTEFGEARTVLIQEGRLFADSDDWEIFVELVASYEELRHFAPSTLEHFFPGVHARSPSEDLFQELLDFKALLARTRPAGAKAPDAPLPPVDEMPSIFIGLVELQAVRQSHRQSPRMTRSLVARSERAAARGNLVRACILLQRARKYASDKDLHRLRAALRGHLVRLVDSLQKALLLPDTEIDAWRDSLSALVARGAVGIRSREGRLLFELQKIAVDYQRQLFTIDTWGWIRSLGTRPLRRPLPRLTEVAVHKHLRSALARVKTARIADIHRQTLHALLQRAEDRSQQQLRIRLRPIIAQALEKAQLLPTNTVERVAARKLVEELIDRILERGFLSMSDLRDAVARNHLKARDLAGPRDFLFGDQLLSADDEMALALDGVYRHGESYLRAMQRLSSVAFGTQTGRLLMRCLILPFGGAYIIVAGLNHLALKITGSEPAVELPPIVVFLGIFLLLLFNIESFRHGLWRSLKDIGRGLRFLATELPKRLMQLEFVRRILGSRYFRWTVRIVVKPMLITGVLAWAMPHLVPRWQNTPNVVGALFIAVNLLINSRLGRDLEELAADWIGRIGHWLGVQVIARIFWLTMDFFRALVELTERLLYTVDEWLRFRSGEGRTTLAVKAVLGAIWFLVAYVTRFCVNLLIEPQVNPIKHFPVVTVSHKVILPFIPFVAGVLELAMDKGLALTVATTVLTCIPGIFGFLAWELRENWRLYAANRSKTLRPSVVGSHGESMRGLLLPGLHSGTIPKRFAKLRGTEKEAAATGRWNAVRKHLGVLEGVHLRVRRFVDRDLLWLLNEASCWNGSRIYLAQTSLAVNRVRVELRLDETDGAMFIEFDARNGWLLGSLSGLDAIQQLSRDQREALAMAVAGLYKAAGVDLIRQEIENQLPSPPPLYDLDENQLVIWPSGMPKTTIRYELDDQLSTTLYTIDGPVPPEIPDVQIPRVLFGQIPLAWSSWVETWETLAARNAGGSPDDLPDRLWQSEPTSKVLP